MRPNMKKFLAPEVLQDAAEQVARIAKEQGVAAVLMGGYAMHLYGSDRLTGDIDFGVDAPLSGFRLVKKLSFGGIRTRAPNGVPLDLIVREDDYRALYEAAVAVPIPQKGRTGVMVVRPEYLVAIKMAANREKDWGDVERLVNGGAISMPKTREIVREYLGVYAVHELDQAVAIAEWKRAREEG